MMKRNQRKHQTRKIKTARFENSAIQYMTKLLNNEQSRKREIIIKQLIVQKNQTLNYFVPVNFRLF